jgi:hypothetical protein
MKFRPKKTSELLKGGAHKVLLYSHHGFGKTYQCRFYQKRYGKGLIVSGEAGLKSVEDTDIDYIPFTSWDGVNDEDKGEYSFMQIFKWITNPAFLDAQGYKWIAIDSLTEMSDRLMEHLEEKHKDNKNGFEKWGDNNRLMMGVMKKIRDLPVHVYVTSLAKEEADPNGVTQYWLSVQGGKLGKQIPALFDHVFGGVRTTEVAEGGQPKVRRWLATEEVSGWHGKVRDPQRRLDAIEKCDDVTEMLTRMSETKEQFDKRKVA